MTLEVRDLVVRFRAERGHPARTVLDGVRLDAGPGQVLGIRGANGAGKSTLLACLSGWRRPAEGTVTWNGVPTLDHRRCAKIGVLPEGDPLPGFLRAKQAMDLLDPGGPPGAASLLAQLGMADLAECRVRTLSWGLRRRVALAQSLLGSPSLVLWDEPCSGQDPQAVEAVQTLARTAADGGAVVVLVSHVLPVVLEACDRILDLVDGSLTEQG